MLERYKIVIIKFSSVLKMIDQGDDYGQFYYLIIGTDSQKRQEKNTQWALCVWGEWLNYCSFQPETALKKYVSRISVKS